MAAMHARVRTAFLYIGAMVFYMAVRISAALPAARYAGPLTDTAVFVDMGSAPLFSRSFLAGLRPPAVPLVYKFFNSDFFSIIIFQTIVSSVCWLFLAWTVSCCVVNRKVRIGFFLIVLLTGMSWPVTVWESSLLSESISISLMVAVIGAWVLFIRRSNLKRLAFLIASSLAWLFCRETNSWLILIVAVVCLGVAFLRKEKKYLALSVVLTAAFAINDVSSTLGGRWVFPFLNVLSQRILPDPTRTADFASAGMPVSKRLCAMKYQWASSGNYKFYNDPNLAEFRQWLYTKGKKTYMRWLIAHPATTLREPIEHIECMFAAGIMHWYAAPASITLLPSMLSKCVFPIGYERYFSLLLVWCIVLCAGIAIGAKAWNQNGIWIFVIILVFLAYPHMLIVWHGDAMEVSRHSMMARVQLNLSLWMMVCLFLDHLITECRKNRDALK